MNEVAGLVKRIMRGVELTPETVPLDLIDQVGPGGHFLGEEHTFQHFRRNWIPELFDRSPRDEWEQDGELTLGDRAASRVRHILDHHEPASLDEDIATALEGVIQRAEQRVQ
jgi:trimethylamine--corrinoid protein Co-methyltransferase